MSSYIIQSINQYHAPIITLFLTIFLIKILNQVDCHYIPLHSVFSCHFFCVYLSRHPVSLYILTSHLTCALRQHTARSTPTHTHAHTPTNCPTMAPKRAADATVPCSWCILPDAIHKNKNTDEMRREGRSREDV